MSYEFASSNCIFMELKLVLTADEFRTLYVLIVPLWN